MATPPVFSAGAVLTAAQMNGIGLWLVHSQTLTGANSYNFDNVFTTEFENYRIVYRNQTQSANQNVQIQMRTGGVNHTANYFTMLTWLDQTGVAGTITGNNVGQAEFAFPNMVSYFGSTSVDVLAPKNASATLIHGTATTQFGAGITNGTLGILVNIASTFDGFRLFSNPATTFGGKIRIYGYRD